MRSTVDFLDDLDRHLSEVYRFYPVGRCSGVPKQPLLVVLRACLCASSQVPDVDASVSLPQGSLPSADVDVKAPSADLGVEGGVGGVDVPSVGGGIAGSMPEIGGGVDRPSASVDMPSGPVDMPSGSIDMPSGSVDMPSVNLAGNVPDMSSVGGEVSGDLPSVDAKLTGPDVDVEGGGVSLGAGLAAGATAAVGAVAVGLGLSGKADKPEGEVRASVCVFCFIGGGTLDTVVGACNILFIVV